MHELYPGETQKITVEWGGNGLSDESNDSEIMSESGSGQEGEEGIPRAVNEGNGHRGAEADGMAKRDLTTRLPILRWKIPNNIV
jgi:hypothetical protein